LPLTDGKGGENVYPGEIEERLLEHPSISQAAAIGARDQKYGEIVAAVLALRPGSEKMALENLRQWVQLRLGRHKAPAHVFWVGAGEHIADFPLTGSGKFRKDILRDLVNQVVSDSKSAQPKL
jgi:mevalonyl-CoA ligase